MIINYSTDKPKEGHIYDDIPNQLQASHEYEDIKKREGEDMDQVYYSEIKASALPTNAGKGKEEFAMSKCAAYEPSMVATGEKTQTGLVDSTSHV